MSGVYEFKKACPNCEGNELHKASLSSLIDNKYKLQCLHCGRNDYMDKDDFEQLMSDNRIKPLLGKSNNQKIRPYGQIKTPRVPNRQKPINVRLDSYIDGLMDDDGVTLENTAEVLVYDVNKMFKPMLDLLIWNAYEAYSASLMKGNDDRFIYHESYMIGDMVMEISTIMNETCHMDRIGKVLNIYDRDRGLVEIETLDGRSFTWDNANFIRVHDKVFR